MNKSLQCREKCRRVRQERRVPGAGDRRQSRARQVLRVIARRAHRHQPVALALDHQRRRIDTAQHAAPVFFLEQTQAGAQRRRDRFAVTEYFAQATQHGAVVTGGLQSQEAFDGAGIVLFQILRELIQYRGWHGVRPVRRLDVLGRGVDQHQAGNGARQLLRRRQRHQTAHGPADPDGRAGKPVPNLFGHDFRRERVRRKIVRASVTGKVGYGDAKILRKLARDFRPHPAVRTPTVDQHHVRAVTALFVIDSHICSPARCARSSCRINFFGTTDEHR
jgi:hypothetical protein